MYDTDLCFSEPDETASYIDKLEAENKRLREALEQLRLAKSEKVRKHVEKALEQSDE